MKKADGGMRSGNSKDNMKNLKIDATWDGPPAT
jgi:hypothetical protein